MNEKYVVILSVGPVQTFISAARRSRDLWSGSWLLSELSKACACSLAQQGAELIFPNITNKSFLKENSDFSVGNKIQVVLTVGDSNDIRQMVELAKKATICRFKREAEQARKELNCDEDLRLSIWNSQLEDYVEVQAAWALMDSKLSEAEGYKKATVLASSVLSARKATRDFNASSTNPYDSELMLPKSSLDGARETVIQEDKKLKSLSRVRLSLSTAEQLDCAGVVKRLGFDKKVEQFTPYTRVAANAWVEKASQDPQFEKIITAYEALFNLRVATRVRGNQNLYQCFAYDAEYLYENRIEAACREYDFNPDVLVALQNLKTELKPLWHKFGQPNSYGVMLLADGDRMGELLDQAKNKQEHKQITRALSEFADSVPELMRQYNGQCIYSGGDDVLGFVPLHQAYKCAKALSDSFANALSEVSTHLGGTQNPTLSVGLAICHVNTPLGVIRELANQAETHAKGDHCPLALRRNALGIVLSVRSGTQTFLRIAWDDTDAHQQFKQWVSLYESKKIPSRLAYDTRAIDLSTKNISSDLERLKKIREAELKRMLQKKRLVSGEKVSETTMDALTQRAHKVDLQQLSDELIVARWFAAKLQKDLGKE